jgi:hypothetical protein
MRGRHDALVVFAVPEIQGVAQLVDRFFEETLIKQAVIPLKPVELLAQPVCGNDCTWAGHLRFSEDVFQNRDVEIDVGDRQHTQSCRRTSACMRRRISEE